MEMFSYNQDSAVKAGDGLYITESGAYEGTLSAKWTVSKGGSQSKFLELSLKTDSGTANYLSICYKKNDGSDNQMGADMINAIMGLLKLKSLTSKRVGNDDTCPELESKSIGLVLQKVLYAKTNGDDGYKFDIKIPYSATTKKTLREALTGEEPKTVVKMLTHLIDRDDRKHNTSGATTQRQPSTNRPTPADEFEDDIPF